MRKEIYIFCLVSVIASYLSAQIIHIPMDKSTIQAGIDAASDGDTVLVDQGTYYENINFLGKAIILSSHYIFDKDTNHIVNTIIDGSQPANPDIGTVITLDSGEDTTSVIYGFTITGGTGTYFPAFDDCAGGAILSLYSGAKIIHNYIEYNSVNSPTVGYGGAIEQYGDHFIILKNNRIRYNENNGNSGAFGGAAEISGSAIIINNTFANNTSNSSTGESGGGALSLSCYNLGWESEIIVSNNTFYGNIAYCGEEAVGGALWVTSEHGIISNNTIIGNQINAGSIGYGSGIMLTASDTNLLVEGNIIANNDYIFGSTLGGGICIYLGKAKLINNIIRDNYSSYGGGLAIIDTIIFGSTYPSVLINNTITNNHASEEGGGLLIETAEAIIFNTIIWGNEALVGTEIFDGSSSLEVQYSDIGGSGIWPGDGNINVGPLFIDDSCHLSVCESQCINQGTEYITVNDVNYYCPIHDIDGEPRPYLNTAPDIGADETPCLDDYIASVEKSISLDVYPNPFTSIVSFKFSSEKNENINLSIINSRGQLIYEKSNVQSEGNLMQWNGSDIPSGIYYYRITSKTQSAGGKLIKMP